MHSECPIYLIQFNFQTYETQYKFILHFNPNDVKISVVFQKVF